MAEGQFTLRSENVEHIPPLLEKNAKSALRAGAGMVDVLATWLEKASDPLRRHPVGISVQTPLGTFTPQKGFFFQGRC
jgi:hypothetical protein